MAIDQIPAGSDVPVQEAPAEVVEPEVTGETSPELENVQSAENAELKNELTNLKKVLGNQGRELGTLRQEANNKNNTPEPAKDFDSLEVDIMNKLDSGELDLNNAMREMNRLATEKGAKLATEAIRGEQKQERDAEAVKQFKAENADFDELNQSGALDEILASNPIQDPISAYYLFKHDQLAGSMDTKLAEAKKTGEEEGLKIAGEKTNASKVLGKKGNDTRNKQEKQPYNDRASRREGMLSALRASRE